MTNESAYFIELKDCFWGDTATFRRYFMKVNEFRSKILCVDIFEESLAIGR